MDINSPLLCDMEGIQTIAWLSVICHVVGFSMTIAKCLCLFVCGGGMYVCECDRRMIYDHGKCIKLDIELCLFYNETICLYGSLVYERSYLNVLIILKSVMMTLVLLCAWYLYCIWSFLLVFSTTFCLMQLKMSSTYIWVTVQINILKSLPHKN